MASSQQQSSSRIRMLAPNVVNKIAAGEVVERPASVLKELLENSIDAGAGRIEIHLDSGGCRRISVVDDASGMNRDDALLAIERHATSKIHDIEDIERIDTLGFRGEALAAIASVSRFRLLTSTGGESPGTEIAVFGGVIKDVRETGFPRGSTIEVSNLFFNVPARRKFMRTPQTELAHCRQTVTVHALAHPDIGFSLHVDGNSIMSLAAGESLEQRLQALLGTGTARSLCPVALSTPFVRLQGFAGIPPESRRDRDQQFFFINGRPAGTPLIGYAVRESYHSLLPRGRHPPLIMFIDTDPGRIDVNVHPRKSEVRFRDPAQIRDAIQQAITEGLQSAGRQASGGIDTDLMFRRKQRSERTEWQSEPRLAYPEPASRTATGAHNNFRQSATGLSSPAASGNAEHPPAGASRFENDGTDETSAALTPPWRSVRVVGQVGGLFVLLETDDGLVIMDPHAAHERVLFDRYLRAAQNGRPASQELLMPATVTLPPVDAAVLKPHLERLQSLGFGIHEFGMDVFMIDAVPVGFENMSPAEWVGGLVADFKHEGSGRRLPRVPREESIARAACHAAVKAHQRLGAEEIEQLVTDLAVTEMPYTCPHGRPILIHFSFSDLNNRFGR